MKLSEKSDSKRECSSKSAYKERVLDTSYMTGSLDIFHKYSNYLNNLWAKNSRKQSESPSKPSPSEQKSFI